MSLSSNNNTFTFTWKIRYISMCVFGNDNKECNNDDGEDNDNHGCTQTPDISVEWLDKIEWCLGLSLKDDYLSCCLRKQESEHSSGNIKIGCSMTLVSVDNLLNCTKTRNFCNFDELGCEKFVLGKTDDIFAKPDIFLPNDTLTIRCCMWRTNDRATCHTMSTDKEVAIKEPEDADPEEKLISDQTTALKSNLIKHVYAENIGLHSALSEKMYLSATKNLEILKMHSLPNACTILSQITCERRRKTWEIKKFNEIQVGETFFTTVSGMTDAPSLVLALYLSKDCNDDVCMDIQLNYNTKCRYVVKCMITILNALYEDQDCINDKYLFNDGTDIWCLPLIKKSKLCKYQNLYKGSLLLRCELVISEEDSLLTVERTVSFPNVEDPTDEVNIGDWKLGLLRTLKNGDFYDVVLKSGEKRFNAHKVILSASSPVFKDLLEDDLDEQTIDVEDCEPDILDKLLEYMYSGVVEEMTIESCMKLFSAAKAYKVLNLERQCLYKLRYSLDVFNVSQVLLLADLQQDEVMKMAALKFISLFQDEVCHSLSWKEFMVENAKIAGEAMHYVLTRKFD